MLKKGDRQMPDKKKKEIIKNVNRAFDRLYVLNNISLKPHREILFKDNLKQEREHRKLCFLGATFKDEHPNAVSMNDCARFWTVQGICDSLIDPNKWEMNNYIYLSNRLYYSQSLVLTYRDKIEEALKDEDINYLASIPYSDLVS